MDRRAYLGLSASALIALTGCTGDGSDSDDTTTTTTATTATTTTTTTTAEPTATTTTTAESTTTTTTTTTAEPTATTTTTTTTTPEKPASSMTVRVAPDGNLRFDPETFRLAAGGTVTWEWDAPGHNVIADTVPDGSDWEGTPGGTGETYDSGYSYEYTFEVTGDYEYYCAPHRNFDMVGSFTVV